MWALEQVSFDRTSGISDRVCQKLNRIFGILFNHRKTALLAQVRM